MKTGMKEAPFVVLSKTTATTSVWDVKHTLFERAVSSLRSETVLISMYRYSFLVLFQGRWSRMPLE